MNGHGYKHTLRQPYGNFGLVTVFAFLLTHTVQAQPVARVEASEQGIVYNPENGHYYEIVLAPDQIAWTEARDVANSRTYEGMKGYLATITSPSENDVIKPLVGYYAAWLGGNDATTEGVWRWVTGPEGLENNGAGRQFWQGGSNGHNVSGAFTFWNYSEPNNFYPQEDYLMMWGQCCEYGYWNDGDDPGWPQSYIIEYGGLEDTTDVTPPFCGDLQIIQSGGKNVAVRVIPSDPGSGIQSVEFITMHNATGIVNGSMGPYVAGDRVDFSSPLPIDFELFAGKILPARKSIVTIRVTNGAGLTQECDPVMSTLSTDVPETFHLEQNYPNPFNPTTTIRFQVAESGDVLLDVIDVLGRPVITLVDGELQPGTYESTWEGKDGNGKTVPSGVYLYRLQVGSYVQYRTMTLVK